MNKYDIVVIGGGAAGSMAAICARENGASVVLIEKNAVLGRKILATGNGRCNITNKLTTADNYHGGSKEFVKSILKQFDQFQTMNFFENLGIILKEEDSGRMFPRTNQASTVVEALEFKFGDCGVDIIKNCEIKKIAKNGNWTLSLSNGDKVEAKKIIICTGGKAAHYLGSSGDGIFWAKNLGHNIIPIYASLVPIEVVDQETKDLQGLKIEATVSLWENDEMLSSRYGDLLFTHFGLSGPAIMSQAREIAPSVFEGRNSKVKIDVFPDMQPNELNQVLVSVFSIAGRKSIKNALSGVVPERLAEFVIKSTKLDPNMKSAEMSKIDRQSIVSKLKFMEFKILRLRPLKEAQVTRGGVDCSEIDQNTMESKIVKDLYFAGEVVDVDGDSGGFNLQWAWSTGYVAGTSAAK